MGFVSFGLFLVVIAVPLIVLFDGGGSEFNPPLTSTFEGSMVAAILSLATFSYVFIIVGVILIAVGGTAEKQAQGRKSNPPSECLNVRVCASDRTQS